MAPLARRLCSRFRILEPLQRAGGDVPLTVARHVADLHDVLRDSLKEGPVRLAGYSWGAMLALTYAARYPSEVDRAILIGCGTFDVQARKVYQSNLEQRMDPEDKRRVLHLEALLAEEKDRKRRNEYFTEFGELFTRIQSFDPIPADPEVVLPCDEQGFRETWADALSLQEQGVQPAEFASIQAPVTMIHGSEDPHPGSMIRDSLAGIISNLQYMELPRCGHKPWAERQACDAFYKLLFECLQ
jgi:pimeloyl-ACP methyl ester carboxylesterase